MLVIFILLFSTLFSQNNGKKNIAVIDFDSRGGLSASEIGILTDRLRSLLVRTNAFNVVDRGRMQNILDEQGFQMSGCTSTECAVEAGKILGVEQMVAGSIGRIGSLYTIDLILIDTETSRIVKSLTRDYTGGVEGLVKEMQSLANELAGVEEKKVAAAKGGIEIVSDPDGADIFMDGKIVGKTPLTMTDVSAKSHTFKIKKRGYRTYTETITIEPDQFANINTTLKREWILSITSEPSGAEVFLNNKKVGTTPFKYAFPDELELKIELRKKGYETWNDEITMDDNQVVKAEMDPLVSGKETASGGSGGNTWLWIGGGALVVGGAAAFLLMPQDNGSTPVTETFPKPPARP
jgi:hypothetical protein